VPELEQLDASQHLPVGFCVQCQCISCWICGEWNGNETEFFSAFQGFTAIDHSFSAP
jgi:hypothetical protein